MTELQEKIIQLLKDNDGRMEAEKVCNLLGITMNEIPWGYNIGWARCLQVGGVYHLILSGQRAGSSVVEQLSFKQHVVGSIPTWPTKFRKNYIK